MQIPDPLSWFRTKSEKKTRNWCDLTFDLPLGKQFARTRPYNLQSKFVSRWKPQCFDRFLQRTQSLVVLGFWTSRTHPTLPARTYSVERPFILQSGKKTFLQEVTKWLSLVRVQPLCNWSPALHQRWSFPNWHLVGINTRAVLWTFFM